MTIREVPNFQVAERYRSCYVEIGDVTIYLDHSIEGQPILVDAWKTIGNDGKSVPITVGRSTLDLDSK